MRGAMRGQLFSMIIMLLCMGSLVTTIFWFLVDKNYADYNPPRPQKKEKPGVLCKGCKKVIDDVNQHFSEPWQKQEENYKKLRSLLNSNCSGFDTAIITQTNTPLGTKIKYDGEDTYLTVTPTIFKTFLKEHPFLNKTWNTCAVVGNGGILAESYCGKMIDSAELVMRCNLPPVTGEYERHVGSKTDFVTANPTIVKKKYGSLNNQRRPFVESLSAYGNALVLFSPFTFKFSTAVSMRAFYTLQDFDTPTRIAFFNPQYFQKLKKFWRSYDLKAYRLSTGIIMASIALEVCSDVHLYGFWPFHNHPHSLQYLTQHYYDHQLPGRGVHNMPTEFNIFLNLHRQGVLRLHLGKCKPGEK
ncbi:alpha-2,8-sialyltransferase 8F-like isoform 1-T1 [Pholidichthys leucotaenia]